MLFPFSLFLLSGGGNDLLGDALPDLLRHRSEVARGWRGLIVQDALDRELGRLRQAFQRVIARTAEVRPNCQILVHGYDYPFPRDKGTTLFWGRLTVAGPWIQPVMEDLTGIFDPLVQRKLVAELIDRFNRDVLRTLANAHGQFHHVDLRDTLWDVRQWDDEIHPRSAGFRRMAKNFKAHMDRLAGR